jgi:hypothetical protein
MTTEDGIPELFSARMQPSIMLTEAMVVGPDKAQRGVTVFYFTAPDAVTL